MVTGHVISINQSWFCASQEEIPSPAMIVICAIRIVQEHVDSRKEYSDLHGGAD